MPRCPWTAFSARKGAANDLAAARALRNRIAHEYDAEGWRQIACAAYALTPSLLSVEGTLTAGQRLVAA